MGRSKYYNDYERIANIIKDFVDEKLKLIECAESESDEMFKKTLQNMREILESKNEAVSLSLKGEILTRVIEERIFNAEYALELADADNVLNVLTLLNGMLEIESKLEPFKR